MGPQNSAQENFRQSEIRAQNEQAGRDAAYAFDTSYSSMGLRTGAGNGVGLSYAGMRATGLPDEGQYARTTTPDLDTSAVAALRENLGLPEAAPDMGWQLADLGLRLGRSTGGYGPALRLGTMSASPLRAVPTQPEPVTTDPGIIDYANYAERFTPPGVDLGSGDLLKTVKEAALNKLVEWGATSPEDSAWRRAMGVSYALTDAVLPGSYGEAAIGAGAGPLIGKGIVLGTGALNATASKYALTSWAADDLGVLASQVGERLGANLAAPRRLNPQFGGVLVDSSAGDAVGGIGLKLGNRRLPEADLPWIIYQKHVTGRGYEEIWQLGQSKIALDARRFGFTVEAKWAGRNESAWKSSPYHPDHRYYNEAKILNQARSQLELNESLGGKGVRYSVSNAAAQSHFSTLFERNFGTQMKLGTLQVWHVPGNGMR